MRGLRLKTQARPWSPDRVGDDRALLAGVRPRTTRSFCFGKRTQNHGRPGVALRVPLPRSRRLGLRNSLRSDSPRPTNRVRDWGAATPAGPEVAPWDGALQVPKTKGEGRIRCGHYRGRGRGSRETEGGGLGRGLLPGLPFLLLAFSGTIALLLPLRGPKPVSDPWSSRGRVLIYGLFKDVFSWM